MAAKRRLMDFDCIPDDMWTAIFTTGINKSGFDIRDISNISISCKRFNKLSEEDGLWSDLLTLDFPPNVDDKEGDHRNSDYQFSSKKDIYMNTLKRHLRDELMSHWAGIMKSEEELMYYNEGVVHGEASRCATIQEFSTRYRMFINDSINDNQREAFEVVYRLKHTLSEQLKDVLGELLNMIYTREPGAPFDYQPPLLSSYSMNIDCSSVNPDELQHIAANLKSRVQGLLSQQKNILDNLKRVHSHINDLIHRQLERDQKMEKIKSRLSLLASSLKINDSDYDYWK